MAPVHSDFDMDLYKVQFAGTKITSFTMSAAQEAVE